MCISLASIFLALVIGTRGSELKKFASTVSSETVPFWKRKKVRWEQLQKKTAIADEAMRAKAEGRQFRRPRDFGRAA
ncbi:MAG: hypothetical protein R3E02_12365 [Blastomonas sp.]